MSIVAHHNLETKEMNMMSTDNHNEHNKQHSYEHEYSDQNGDFMYRNETRYNEEFASDIVPTFHEHESASALGFGVLGLILGLVALFFHPVLFGLSAFFMGSYALSKGSKVLGASVVIIGLLALVFPLFFGGAFSSIF